MDKQIVRCIQRRGRQLYSIATDERKVGTLAVESWRVGGDMVSDPTRLARNERWWVDFLERSELALVGL